MVSVLNNSQGCSVANGVIGGFLRAELGTRSVVAKCAEEFALVGDMFERTFAFKTQQLVRYLTV